MNRKSQPEGDTKKAVKQVFAWRDWLVLNNWQGPMSEPGRTDLEVQAPATLYSYPVLIHLEIKRPPSSRNPRGHVRKQQWAFITRCWEKGIPAMVVDSLDQVQPIAEGKVPLNGLLDYTMSHSWLPNDAALPHLW